MRNKSEKIIEAKARMVGVSLLGLLAFAVGAVQAQSPSSSSAGNAVTVTPDNFVRAETDMIFADSVKTQGLGKFLHHREPMSIDFPIVRPNRDTPYSLSVFDLDSGPLTITLPSAGQRFMSMQVIDEDHYTPNVFYGAGTHTFTRDKIGTRYVSLGVRILVDPNDPEDVKQVHALQDAITVTQPGGPGRFEAPNWDQTSQKKVRDALLALAQTVPDTKRTFGARDQVDPVRHLIGTAFAFGGNPEKDALYLNVTPSKNDGTTVHRLTVKDVPVDAFWSISVYNAEGHFQKNAFNAYSLNKITAKKAQMARSLFNSAVVTVKSTTVCQSCPAGTTWCVFIAREKKSSMEFGSSQRRSRNDTFPKKK